MEREHRERSTQIAEGDWSVALGARASNSYLLRWLLRLAPALAVAVILTVDLLLAQRPWPLLLDGTLDEVGHILTAALVLAALPHSSLRRLWPWALLGAVAIDIDHVPLYTFAPGFNVDGRPPTHSLLTVLVLCILAAAIPAARVAFAGVALGVCLHFVRDLATGPGVPLFWPLRDSSVLLPYLLYLAVITGAAAIATWKIVRGTGPAAALEAGSALPA